MRVILRFDAGRIEPRDLVLPMMVGRGARCDVVLQGWRVARQHARFERKPHGVFVEDLGSLCGTWINGKRIAVHGPLTEGDQIMIGECLIQVIDTLAVQLPQTLPTTDDASRPVMGGALLIESESFTQAQAADTTQSWHTMAPPSDYAGLAPDPHPRPLTVYLQHQQRLHTLLLGKLDLRRRDVAAMSDHALRAEAQEALSALLASDDELPESLDRQQLMHDVLNEAIGLGPLEALLADHAVTEIMVNRHDQIYVESHGRIHPSPVVFSSEQAVLRIIERIVAPLGRRIDESSPMVDARLHDGSRVNAVISPIALKGCCLTIRKFPVQRLSMQDLVDLGTMDQYMSQFLEICVRQRCNIIVSGGTGSGKTTLLNVLSNAIPADERIITIEDAAELQLNHVHCVSLEARPANTEGRGRIEIRDLVRNALRMRPDRIVVGECRGSEAFDMLSAMNTGHEGSLTTLHANTPRDALSRLETMILMAGMDLPLSAVREHIAASVHFIVQQSRLSSGQRVITSIVEVTGIESGRIQLQPIFSATLQRPWVFSGQGVMPERFVRQATTDANDLSCADLTIDLFQQRTTYTPRVSAPVGFPQRPSC